MPPFSEDPNGGGLDAGSGEGPSGAGGGGVGDAGDAGEQRPMGDCLVGCEGSGVDGYSGRLVDVFAEYLSSEKVSVGYDSVSIDGQPVVGLYDQGAGQDDSLNSHVVPFDSLAGATVSGSHDFGELPPGIYEVRLVFNIIDVAHAVSFRVLSDRDRDGRRDSLDLCPDDPSKATDEGRCGCGVAETDQDGDKTPDCIDGCNMNPDKVEAGQCGCDQADTDRDGDGSADCVDECDDDPDKSQPGACGCGMLESKTTDQDADGIMDCFDACPYDGNKSEPLHCGCGALETDSDGDGLPGCEDECDGDPNKFFAGVCGCGTPEEDDDKDGTENCIDECPLDPAKTAAGRCGCGHLETACQGTVTLKVADTFVTSGAPGSSFGNATRLEIDTAPDVKIAYIKPISLAGIPAGATVEAASLKLRVYDEGHRISVRPPNGSWSTSMTYNNRMGYGGQVAEASGKGGSKSIDLRSVVQNWVNGAAANGVVLVPTGDDGVDMYSAQSSNASYRPRFEVRWYKPVQ